MTPRTINAETLRHMAERGDDLTRPRPIDFAHVFPDEASARAFAAAATAAGFAASIEDVEEEDRAEIEWWDVVISRSMIPSEDAITSIEAQLDMLAQDHGGQADGWGCFAVATGSA